VSRSTKEAELSACWRVLRIWRDCQDNTGWSHKLSTGPVKVIFASSHTNADRVILERIREAKTPTDIKLVSSDSSTAERTPDNSATPSSSRK